MLVIFKLCFWISLMFTCRPQDPKISNKIIDSIEHKESRGKILVKNNNHCTGLMQVDHRYTPVHRSLLRIPFVNRVVGVKAIRKWNSRSGDIKLALAAYNCGNKGLEGKCGIGYANSVMSMNINHRRTNINECSLIGKAINYYLDNEHYLVKWGNKKWLYRRLYRHQRQRL